jgi:hypothetical protein
MAINDWGSPRLAAFKMLFDELFPLVVCNTVSVSLDSPIFNIAVVCVNPHREVTIMLSDDGMVKVKHSALGQVREVCFELVDPRCSVRVLDWVLDNDVELFRSHAVSLGVAVDRFGDLRRRVGVFVGGVK